jgi:aspartyl-tRNA(Asn)/glutamyl-tRNA(Gln) amidotransferase subunit A
MAGGDDRDATSSWRTPEIYHDSLSQSVQGKTIGIPREFFTDAVDQQVQGRLHDAIKVFEDLGVRGVEVSMPHIKYAVSIYYLIALSETSSNLGRYDGVRYGKTRKYFTPETNKRIILGTYALSAGYAEGLYKKAQKLRTILIKEYADAFKHCEALIAPVAPWLPPTRGEMINDPIRNFMEELYTGTVNLVGSPSLALPAGFSTDGLPIGMQLIGKKFSEGELLAMGHAYQQVTDWHTRIPPVCKNET